MTGYSLVLSILDTIPDCYILRAGTLRLPDGVGRYWARWSWASEVCCSEHDSTLPREVFFANRPNVARRFKTRLGLTKLEGAEEIVPWGWR